MDILSIINRAGGASRIAAACGIDRRAVYQWKWVPADRLRVVSELSGIPAHQLRPDIIPDPSKQNLNGDAA